MGAIIRLDVARAKRRVCTHVVYFYSPKAAEIYGAEFGDQRLYAWSLAEAEQIAKERGGRIEAL